MPTTSRSRGSRTMRSCIGRSGSPSKSSSSQRPSARAQHLAEVQVAVDLLQLAELGDLAQPLRRRLQLALQVAEHARGLLPSPRHALLEAGDEAERVGLVGVRDAHRGSQVAVHDRDRLAERPRVRRVADGVAAHRGERVLAEQLPRIRAARRRTPRPRAGGR